MSISLATKPWFQRAITAFAVRRYLMLSAALTVGGGLPLLSGRAPLQARAHGKLFVRAEGRDVRVAIQLTIDSGWHAYHGPSKADLGPADAVGMPTKIVVTAPGVTFGDARYPRPERMEQEVGQEGTPTWIYGHEGTITLYVRGEIAHDAKLTDVRANVSGLTCEAKGTCLPFTFELSKFSAGADDLFATFPIELSATASGQSSEPKSTPGMAASEHFTDAASSSFEFPDYRPHSEATQHGLAMWLVLAFVAGVILNFMPCVLPVVSIKVLSFVQQAGRSRARVLQLGLAFSAGIIVVFLALAGLAAFAGKGWGEQFQDTRFLVVMIAIVFAFSLSMFDVFELGVPSGVGQLAGSVRGEGLGDAFLRGVLATLLATPCSGPFLGSTLAWAVAQSTSTIFLVFGMIGLGMAAPYVWLTASPRALELVPKPGPWMETFKHAMGFVLLATVVYLMTSLRSDLLIYTVGFLVFVALACWLWGRFATFDRSRAMHVGIGVLALGVVVLGARLSFVEFRHLYGAGGESRVEWAEFDAEALVRHGRERRSVFVDFTANWCPNCKLNEFNVYESAEMCELFEAKGILVMKADITNDGPRTEQIRSLMKELGASSIPLAAVFPGGTPLEPIVLRDIVTKAELRRALQSCPDAPAEH